MSCGSLRTLGVPAGLGGGESGIPLGLAVRTQLCAVREWLADDDNAASVDRVVFCAWGAREHEVLEQLMRAYFPVAGDTAPEAPPLPAAATPPGEPAGTSGGGEEMAGDAGGEAAAARASASFLPDAPSGTPTM